MVVPLSYFPSPGESTEYVLTVDPCPSCSRMSRPWQGARPFLNEGLLSDESAQPDRQGFPEVASADESHRERAKSQRDWGDRKKSRLISPGRGNSIETFEPDLLS